MARFELLTWGGAVAYSTGSGAKRQEIIMALDPFLLEILACPECKADIKVTADEKGLKCVQCHRVYPIRDDIPVMLIEESAIEPGRAVKN